MGHVHDGRLRGAKHAIDFPHVLSVCINHDAAERRGGPGEGHQETAFVAPSLYRAVEHTHPLFLTGSEAPFMVPVGEPHSSAD